MVAAIPPDVEHTLPRNPETPQFNTLNHLSSTTPAHLGITLANLHPTAILDAAILDHSLDATRFPSTLQSFWWQPRV